VSVVLSGKVLCDELITRQEEFYRLWCVVVCDIENLMNEEALAHWGLSRQKQTNYLVFCLLSVINYTNFRVQLAVPDFVLGLAVENLTEEHHQRGEGKATKGTIFPLSFLPRYGSTYTAYSRPSQPLDRGQQTAGDTMSYCPMGNLKCVEVLKLFLGKAKQRKINLDILRSV